MKQAALAQGVRAAAAAQPLALRVARVAPAARQHVSWLARAAVAWSSAKQPHRRVAPTIAKFTNRPASALPVVFRDVRPHAPRKAAKPGAVRQVAAKFLVKIRVAGHVAKQHKPRGAPDIVNPGLVRRHAPQTQNRTAADAHSNAKSTVAEPVRGIARTAANGTAQRLAISALRIAKLLAACKIVKLWRKEEICYHAPRLVFPTV